MAAASRGRLRARARAVDWPPPTAAAARAIRIAPAVGVAAAPRLPAFLPELDGLRGLAIALVFLVHAEGIVEWGRVLPKTGPGGWLRALVCGGHTGVSLFFVLSGFLVARPVLAALADGRAFDWATYGLRRFWRIVPLYALAVVATTASTARSSADLWRGVPYFFFLGPFLPREDRIAPVVSSVWWSLSTEVQFYLVLPLVVLACGGARGRRRGALVLAGLAGLYALAVGRPFALSNDVYWRIGHSVLGRGPLFAYGALAAWLCERHGARLRAAFANASARRAADAAVVVVAGALCALIGTLMRTHDYVTLEQSHPTWHLAEGALWTSMLLLCVLTPARAAAAFRARALGHLGRISYSVYLLHQPVLFLVFYNVRLSYPGVLPNVWEPITIAATIGVAATVLLLAHATWLAIERPLAWREPRGTRPRTNEPVRTPAPRVWNGLDLPEPGAGRAATVHVVASLPSALHHVR